jgi:hypothetical protein
MDTYQQWRFEKEMVGIYLIASFKTPGFCCFMYGCGEGSLLALQVVELF